MALISIPPDDDTFEPFDADPMEAAVCFCYVESALQPPIVVVNIQAKGTWHHFFLGPDRALELGEALKLSGLEGTLEECGGVEH